MRAPRCLTVIAVGIACLSPARPAAAADRHVRNVTLFQGTTPCDHDVDTDGFSLSIAKEDEGVWTVSYREGSSVSTPCQVIVCSYLKQGRDTYVHDPNRFKKCDTATSTGTPPDDMNKVFSMAAADQKSSLACRGKNKGMALVFVDSGVTAPTCPQRLRHPRAQQSDAKSGKTNEGDLTHIIDIDIVN